MRTMAATALKAATRSTYSAYRCQRGGGVSLTLPYGFDAASPIRSATGRRELEGGRRWPATSGLEPGGGVEDTAQVNQVRVTGQWHVCDRSMTAWRLRTCYLTG